MEKTTINDYPTLLEVINNHIKKEIPSSYLEHAPTIASISGSGADGGFRIINDEGQPKIIPSGNHKFYYRGQHTYYPTSRPSFYRIKEHEMKVMGLLQCHEFFNLLRSHPVLNSLENDTTLSFTALAQHYGFPTVMLDITSDIWAAAFFAVTRRDDKTGLSYPVDENFGDGLGVFYISKPINENTTEFEKAVHPIGYQFFPRPHMQKGALYRLSEEENFNDCQLFDKVLFRHNKLDSELIFSMSYEQRKYYPEDILVDLASEIREKKSISKKSIEAYLESENCDCTEDEVNKICIKNNYQITDSPIVEFDQSYLKESIDWWTTIGRNSLIASIDPFLMMSVKDAKDS